MITICQGTKSSSVTSWPSMNGSCLSPSGTINPKSIRMATNRWSTNRFSWVNLKPHSEWQHEQPLCSTWKGPPFSQSLLELGPQRWRIACIGLNPSKATKAIKVFLGSKYLFNYGVDVFHAAQARTTAALLMPVRVPTARIPDAPDHH